jgi:hypothetical protein
VAGLGLTQISYVPDHRIFPLIDAERGRSDDFHADSPLTTSDKVPLSLIHLTIEGTKIHRLSRAFRYLRLKNISEGVVEITGLWIVPSEFPEVCKGRFECSDSLLNQAWRMGIDTVHLCTQPGPESLRPVFGPFGSGFVQWDGVYRDREIWGGDLRPGSLAWYYNFQDHRPILNSLYIILSGQHMGCSEHGLFPGSGSSHQTFYEWAFWEVVCLWEHYLHSGDTTLLAFAATTLPHFLKWTEKKFAENADGWIHTNKSWMYTISEAELIKDGPMPSLQAAAAVALPILRRLFTDLGHPEHAKRASSLHQTIQSRFHQAFWNQTIESYQFVNLSDQSIARSCLCTNAWALLADLVPENQITTLLQSIRQNHWRECGSLNLAPPIGCPETHDNTVWPYANAYEVAARFHVGDAEGALEVIRRYIRPHLSLGHSTLFEFIGSEGSFPLFVNRALTLNSTCHAWSGQSSWALQRYLLGVRPIRPGWSTFSVTPTVTNLSWVQGSVVTPHGLIDVELEKRNDRLVGKVTHPKNISPVQSDPRIEFQTK